LNIPTASISISASSDWETKADYVIVLAKDQFDVPYVWGGSTPWVGLDCSGITQYVFEKIGINLPRTSNWQFQYGTPEPKDQLRKGDLVFFKEHGSSTITHVDIYIGNDQMINADPAACHTSTCHISTGETNEVEKKVKQYRSKNKA
jgi:cell wall-associated NlpC family hydrolase